MRYLLFFIVVFLLIRWLSHAYFNRPSVRGPRNNRADNRASKPGKSPSDRFGHIEDADYEVLDDEEKSETRSRE
ncbi:MAG: hypothetical protein LAT84_04750 [Balneolia bacterium]|nr:hypothetical protein [Balneolia bacterium]